MGHFTFTSLGLLAMFLSLSGTEGHCCPVDWLPRNGLCYKVFSTRKTWNDAEMFCRKYKPGCHLASIHSHADSVDLAEYVSDYLIGQGRVWIGLRDTRKDYTWEWTDKSTTNYLPWWEGQPDHYNNREFCVELVDLTGYLKWNDQDCKDLDAFLCQCRF